MAFTRSIDIGLNPQDIPSRWLNFVPELPGPIPEPQDAGGRSQTEILRQIRPRSLREQDRSTAPWIDIPPEVIERLVQVGRPTPLRRAIQLERRLGTPARIFYKREDLLS